MKKLRGTCALAGTETLILANKKGNTEVQAMLLLQKSSLKNF